MSTITQFPSGNSRYRIEFDYLARTFVVVTLVNSANPTLNRVLEVDRDYRFLNPTMIEMLVDQSGFDIVRIHRQTGTDLVVDFRNGSVLTASDLTNSELQAIHIAEEGRDQTVDLAKEYADAAGSSAGNAKDSEDEARRIAASIREAGRIGYITRRSFEKGFNVTTWNEVLLWEADGDYYRWDGTLPKNVPAGSTPESSGGIGLGAWVSVGDAALRSMLASEADGNGDAMIMVKQPLANAIARTQHEVNNDWLSVKDWGAKGDGVTDDTAAIDAACAALTGTSLVTNFRRLYFPHGTYIYNGAGITLPNGTTICGEDLFTIIDASNNTNSGYLVTLVGFGARLETLRLKGNASNANLKGVSSTYNSDNGGIVDAILEDFHYGIDIDKCWYSVYQNIRFRRSSSSVVLTGSHIRIGYNQPTEEVNNVNFSSIWMGEQQTHAVSVHCPTQVLTWNECAFETKGQSRIYFATTAAVNTFILNSCYIEGGVESSSYPYLVEGQTVNQVITCNDCMFRLGSTASSLGKNITINLNGGWSNSPNVALQANNTKVWMSNYRYLGSFSDAPNYGQSGDYDGSAMHSASVMMSPRPMDVRDWNAIIPEMINYKTHPNTNPVEVFKVYIPAATAAPKLMHLEIDILTKSTTENYIIGTEKYMVDITLPEASTALSGALVTKVVSASSSGATLLADGAVSLVSNGYDSATDSLVYTIRHAVANATRLGNSMFSIKGCYSAGGISTSTQKWRIRRV